MTANWIRGTTFGLIKLAQRMARKMAWKLSCSTMEQNPSPTHLRASPQANSVLVDLGCISCDKAWTRLSINGSVRPTVSTWSSLFADGINEERPGANIGSAFGKHKYF